MRLQAVCGVVCVSCVVLAGCPTPDSPGEQLDMDRDADEVVDLAVEEDASQEVDSAREVDLSVSQDMGDVLPDMARDAGGAMDMMVDLGEVEMEPPTYGLLRRFGKAFMPVASFPDVLVRSPLLEPSADVLHLEAKVRIDPELTDANGYYPVTLDLPTHFMACGVTIPIEGVSFDEPEQLVTQDGYVFARFEQERLHLTVRGASTFELPLSGTLSFDEALIPDGCEVPMTTAQAVGFELAMSIKSEPVSIISSVSPKECMIFEEVPSSRAWAAREGLPLGSRLNISVYSEDFLWPLPAHLEPRQPMSLSLYGPEDLDVSEDPLVRTWPIPYTAHEIRLRDVETFEVSPEDDAYVAIEPYFYVPGFAGTPKRLESGERYESWGRQVNALMVYVGALRTQSGAQLCTGHFPDAMHPELAITVSSATPEVCSPWTPDQDRLGDLQHPNAAARWFVGREAVRIDRDGRCELTYSFYLNGEDTPIHTEQLVLDLAQTHSLLEP